MFKRKMFHLALTCTSDSKLLRNREGLKNWLLSMPEKIGMKMIMKPKVVFYKDCPHEDGGVSGFIMIAESHISIHTYPFDSQASGFYADIFSCKRFDH